MPFERDEVLDKLSRTPDRVDRLVEQHPHDLLCQAGAGGGWGAVEIMAFLRDWDEVVSERLTAMLSDAEPEFADEDPDLWSIERDYHSEDPAEVATAFRQRREALIEQLRSLGDDQWQRTGRMPDGTIITVEDLASGLVASDNEQMDALRDILL